MSIMHRAICATPVLLMLQAVPSHAATQTIGFDTDAPNTAAVTALYGLTHAGGGSARVESGALIFAPSGGQAFLDIGSFAGDFSITVQATIFNGAGSTNLGLRLGDNNFVFHPGFPGGAFRIDGPNGHGNQDMGFIPSAQSFNTFTLDFDAGTQTASLTVVDGLDPTLIHVESFVDQNYVAGTTVLGLTAGGSPVTPAVFDSVTITTPDLVAAVPEPSTYALMGLGLLGLAWRSRRRAG